MRDRRPIKARRNLVVSSTSPTRRPRSETASLAQAARSRAACTALALTALAVGSLTACTPTEETRDPARPPGFVEMSKAAGIDFFMRFLANEQGADFKINLYDHGAGLCVGDFDGDGLDDIYFLNQLGRNALYRNRGDGTFEDKTTDARVGLSDRICTSGSFADFDNDGDQDLFVATTRGGNTLLRNDGTGVFEDVTKTAGLVYVGHTQGVAWFDYDNDGLLDLYITNTAEWTLDRFDAEARYFVGPGGLFELVGSAIEGNILYRNQGDGTFADVTEATNAGGGGWGGDIAIFDADDDNDLDLFVTNMFGVNRFLRNDGGKRFEDVTAAALPRTSWGAMGCKPLDFDGDGRLDLFVVDMHSDMWMRPGMPAEWMDERAKYRGPEGPMVEWGFMSTEQATELRELVGVRDLDQHAFGNTLFRNKGGFEFEEISDEADAETFWPWGIAAADYDMNGFEDAFVPSGMGYPFFHWRNVLLMNGGKGKFQYRASVEGIEPRPGGEFLEERIAGMSATRSSRSAAVLDYDSDGRPDLVVNNFNERAYLYHNEFPDRGWVALRLQGTVSNRDAIGAVVRVHTEGRVQVRQVCPAGGYLSQSSNTLYFGLADAQKIDRIEITWPSGARQELRDVTPRKLHAIVEPPPK